MGKEREREMCFVFWPANRWFAQFAGIKSSFWHFFMFFCQKEEKEEKEEKACGKGGKYVSHLKCPMNVNRIKSHVFSRLRECHFWHPCSLPTCLKSIQIANYELAFSFFFFLIEKVVRNKKDDFGKWTTHSLVEIHNREILDNWFRKRKL